MPANLWSGTRSSRPAETPSWAIDAFLAKAFKSAEHEDQREATTLRPRDGWRHASSCDSFFQVSKEGASCQQWLARRYEITNEVRQPKQSLLDIGIRVEVILVSILGLDSLHEHVDWFLQIFTALRRSSLRVCFATSTFALGSDGRCFHEPRIVDFSRFLRDKTCR